ncbi:hypothetical protein K469DRAFT_682636 [Zopfia rhizophila CBS 207.26]|uniref:Uncharacterized protein n=1 Tax=Zopfia rhizophila CBS 207.26 TaxID=1314779 RepID=A0A6A6DB91_9PEZI|nr:hypothetical protein K469DRAFT_682636 [Zopfia rhizophila CBS 207.26]
MKIVGILGLDASARPPYDGFGWVSADVTATTNVDPKIAVQSYVAVFWRVKEGIQALNLSEPSVQALLDQQSTEARYAGLENSSEWDPERLALPYVRAISRLRDELRRTVSSVSLFRPRRNRRYLYSATTSAIMISLALACSLMISLTS